MHKTYNYHLKDHYLFQVNRNHNKVKVKENLQFMKQIVMQCKKYQVNFKKKSINIINK